MSPEFIQTLGYVFAVIVMTLLGTAGRDNDFESLIIRKRNRYEVRNGAGASNSVPGVLIAALGVNTFLVDRLERIEERQSILEKEIDVLKNENKQLKAENASLRTSDKRQQRMIDILHAKLKEAGIAISAEELARMDETT